MPQLQLPIFPAGTTPITAELAFDCQGGKVTYLNGHLPVFQHAQEDFVSDHQKSSFFDLSPEASNIICAEGAIIRPIIHGVLWGEWPAP